MKQIQCKATKTIPELYNLSYERRLQQLELISLDKKRFLRQLIEFYKCLHGFNDIWPVIASGAGKSGMSGRFKKDEVTHESHKK
ncbi:hypothetical protein FHG87_003120 [Trinorchestia longiramus]|nr:hypothetical protein FHG87_003120 [Trinorchestia longiramus]